MKGKPFISALLALTLLLAGVGVLAWFALKPASRSILMAALAIPPGPAAMAAPPAPAARQSAKVDLRRAGPPSAAAMREIDSGKFIVRTEFTDERKKEDLYRQLLLRGGILVVQDTQRWNWWLRSPTQRLPLAQAGLPLDGFALNRPRALPAGEERYTGGQDVRPGEQLFLVMPKEFEARVLTEIEHVLPEPLARYNFAHLSMDLTANGYLEFTLTEVTSREHGMIPMTSRFRGL
jgi:hypothetical protein